MGKLDLFDNMEIFAVEDVEIDVLGYISGIERNPTICSIKKGAANKKDNNANQSKNKENVKPQESENDENKVKNEEPLKTQKENTAVPEQKKINKPEEKKNIKEVKKVNDKNVQAENVQKKT